MKMTLKLKLAAAFSAILLLTAILGAVGITRMSTINDQSTEIGSNWMPSMDVIHRINTATSDLRINEFRHVVSTDADAMRAAEANMAEVLATMFKERVFAFYGNFFQCFDAVTDKSGAKDRDVLYTFFSKFD